MNTIIKLETAKLPKALSDLLHSNQFLKLFSLCAVGVSGLSLILNLVIINKAPLVLTLAVDARQIEQREMPKPDDEIKTAIKRYIELRYKWEPTSVKERLKLAEAFIAPQSLTAYLSATANVAKFSVDRQVMQRVYPDKIEVNLEKKTVSIFGDRVTAIQGLKAAGDLKLELSFDSGPRTRLNPWGIYVVKEREEQ
ncbi:MAG: hypothetical protein SGJ18_06500 [Pseudomonadota bacterium]|nr:hypothetical protein [Pseudomonadota bacterium]